MRNTINSTTYPNGKIYYSALGAEISSTISAEGSYKLCELFDKNGSGIFKIITGNDYIVVEKTPKALFCIEKSANISDKITKIYTKNDNFLCFTTEIQEATNYSFINLSLPVKQYDSKFSEDSGPTNDSFILTINDSSTGGSPKIIFGTNNPPSPDTNPIGTIYIQYTQTATTSNTEGEST